MNDQCAPGDGATALEAGRVEAGRVADRALFMLGPGAERELAGTDTIAWEGLLEVSRRLRRGAEEALLEGFDLTISMLGITGRLTGAPGHTLRQTALADAMGLSLSRVSRVLDRLEQRGLVERRCCPGDARATNVVLTDAGAALTGRAQSELLRFVRAEFFDRLTGDDVAALAAVFTRLLCPAGVGHG
jgi:DNA-binding MarR family transcriptional regulator